MYTQKSIVLCHNDVDDHDDGESTDDDDGNDGGGCDAASEANETGKSVFRKFQV